MGKVKKKPLPTLDKNPVDGDKLIEATKPKKVKCDDKFIKLQTDIDKVGDWLADIDDDLSELTNLVERMAARMGLK